MTYVGVLFSYPFSPSCLLIGAFSSFAFKVVVDRALAGVAQWIEFRPADQRVAGLIPSQGTCLGCRPGPQ